MTAHRDQSVSSRGSDYVARQRSPMQLAVGRFLANRVAVGGLGVLVAIALLALLAPVVAPYSPTDIDLANTRAAPSADHWLGTDRNGRDVLSRMLHAGRVSLAVGVAAALTASLIGLVLGLTAAMVGGRVDGAIMRVADVVLSLPTLIVVLVLAGLVGPSLRTLIIAIGLLEWPTACRIVRGVGLSMREREFIEATRAIGSTKLRISVRHMAPAVLPPLSVVGTLLVASAVLTEAGLSFLGLGVQPPQASWGNMLTAAQSLAVLREMPWLWIPPGVAVSVTVLAVNFVGDGLRDAVDPEQQLL